MKNCTQCKIVFNLTEFVKDKRNKDGVGAVCKSCEKIRSKEKYFNTKEKRSKKIAEWKSKNPDKVKKYEEKHRNSEPRKLYVKEWQKKTIYKNYQRNYAASPKRKRQMALWGIKNPGKLTSYSRRRQALKLKAIPKWLTENDHKKIMSFYVLASDLSIKTGIPHEVDHIIPIQGKKVVGLHVPWNLQVITRKLNRLKGNSLGEKCVD